MSADLSDSKGRFRDVTVKREGDTDTPLPPPWGELDGPEFDKKPPWGDTSRTEDAPRLPAPQRARDFPRADQVVEGRREAGVAREKKAEGFSWIARIRRLVCLRKRRHAEAQGMQCALLADHTAEMGEEERRVRRITPSCYNAMEIHGFFGLVDDGLCGAGRMLIVHQPGWVRGQFLDIKDGDDIHAWHVSGRAGGVLRVLSTGRHRYYSPGQRVTTCTVCVPEEQWERLMQ